MAPSRAWSFQWKYVWRGACMSAKALFTLQPHPHTPPLYTHHLHNCGHFIRFYCNLGNLVIALVTDPIFHDEIIAYSPSYNAIVKLERVFVHNCTNYSISLRSCDKLTYWAIIRDVPTRAYFNIYVTNYYCFLPQKTFLVMSPLYEKMLIVMIIIV